MVRCPRWNRAIGPQDNVGFGEVQWSISYITRAFKWYLGTFSLCDSTIKCLALSDRREYRMMIVICEEAGSPNFHLLCMFTNRFYLCMRALSYGKSRRHCMYCTVMLITSKKRWRAESPCGRQHKPQGHMGLPSICKSTCFSRVPLVCKLVRADGWIHYIGQTEITHRKLKSNRKNSQMFIIENASQIQLCTILFTS